MLVVKVYITKEVELLSIAEYGVRNKKIKLEKIDEIQIKNLGEIAEGVYKYAIKVPKGIKAKISHIRDDGYMPLLAKALALLAKRGRKEYKRREGGYEANSQIELPHGIRRDGYGKGGHRHG